MKDYLKLLIKNKWLVLFLPVTAAFILLSILNQHYLTTFSGDYETIKLYVIPNFHLIVSLMSGWWLILLFSTFISERGNEVFYLYSSTRSVLGCAFFFEVLYLIVILVYFLFLRNSLDLSMGFALSLCAESLFISGLVFFITQLTKNTSIALGTVSVYCIYLLKFDKMNLLEVVSIFPMQDAWNTSSLQQLVTVFALAILFYLAGCICCQKRNVYF